jgi:MscS family membrane protein
MLKRLPIIILFIISFGGNSYSQESLESALNSPYNTVYTHLFYLQDDSYRPEVSAQCMPVGLDSLEAIDLSIKLKQILDGKGLYVHMNRIPANSDYLDTLTNRPLYVLFPQELPEVYLEKSNNKWLYSDETILMIPDLHKQIFPFGTDQLLNWLPETAQKKILGIKIWQFIGFLFLVMMSIILHFILSRVIRFSFNNAKWTKIDISKNTHNNILKAARYLSLVLIFSIIKTVAPMLQLSIRYSEVLQKGIKIAITILLLLFLLKLLNLIVGRAKVLADQTESKMDEQLLPILATLSKIALILLGLFHILSLLDVNVTALIAGISIGGLALALAAQDTVKNLIGSVIIFIDKPFLVDDYIIGNGFEGTVEEVGFRTTRLRGVDTAIVNIPNAIIVNEVQKNLGFRKMRMMGTNLGLTYDTPAEKIESFVEGLRQIINEDNKINSEVFYVFFTEYKDSSLNIMFRIYLEVNNYKEELELKHAINLKILRLAAKMGVSFAFPSTSVYVEQMPNSN